MSLQNTTQIFISHSHRDVELARLLVNVIESFFSVPNRAILCSSVSGYELPLGSLLSDQLRNRLSSTSLLISLLSLNSLASDWVLFELGAAWGIGTFTIPLLIGDLSEDDLPAALKQHIAGRMRDQNDLINMIDVIQDKLGWNIRNQRAGNASIITLVNEASRIFLSKVPEEVVNELLISYEEKLDNLPETQRRILSFIQSKDYLVSDAEIQNFRSSSISELYYRLESLRMHGFIEKQKVGGSSDRPEYGYQVTKEYLNYINNVNNR